LGRSATEKKTQVQRVFLGNLRYTVNKLHLMSKELGTKTCTGRDGSSATFRHSCDNRITYSFGCSEGCVGNGKGKVYIRTGHEVIEGK
jgi:hypothetical protein